MAIVNALEQTSASGEFRTMSCVEDVFHNRGKGVFFQTDFQGGNGIAEWQVTFVDGKVAREGIDDSYISSLTKRWHSLVEKLYLEEGYIGEGYNQGDLASEIGEDEIIAYVNDRDGNVWGGIRVITGDYDTLYTPKVIDVDVSIHRDYNSMIQEIDGIRTLNSKARDIVRSFGHGAAEELFELEEIDINEGREIWKILFEDNDGFDRVVSKIVTQRSRSEVKVVRTIMRVLDTIIDGDSKVFGIKNIVDEEDVEAQMALNRVHDFMLCDATYGIDFSRFVVDQSLVSVMGSHRDKSQIELLRLLSYGLEKSEGTKPSSVMCYIKPYNAALVKQATAVAKMFFNGADFRTIALPVEPIHIDGELGLGINNEYFRDNQNAPMKGYMETPTLLVLSVPAN